MLKMASQPIFQFSAELNYYKPKIWRCFQVSNNITVASLGYILMTMFEMQASHLFRIVIPLHENFRNYLLEGFTNEQTEKMFGKENVVWQEEYRYYEIINENTFPAPRNTELFEAREYKVKEVISDPNSRLVMNYDYGDNWEVSVVLEQIIIDKELPGSTLPRVLDGSGYGIIEDCGGVSGLEDIFKEFKKKKGKKYREYCDWYGSDDLDLSKFDIEDMNFRLKRVPRIYKNIYEYDYEPSRRSIDILERKYLKTQE